MAKFPFPTAIKSCINLQHCFYTAVMVAICFSTLPVLAALNVPLSLPATSWDIQPHCLRSVQTATSYTALLTVPIKNVFSRPAARWVIPRQTNRLGVAILSSVPMTSHIHLVSL